MPALRVLHRKIVEIELGLKRFDLAGLGIANRDPDKTPGLPRTDRISEIGMSPMR
jgi:hypothetical protein